VPSNILQIVFGILAIQMTCLISMFYISSRNIIQLTHQQQAGCLLEITFNMSREQKGI
jgi:amino acid permease